MKSGTKERWYSVTARIIGPGESQHRPFIMINVPEYSGIQLKAKTLP